MRRITLFGAVLLSFVSSSRIYPQGYSNLVAGDKPKSAIIISENATESEIFAAEKLREYIFKISGVKLPLHRDDDLDRNWRMLIISVGKTRWLRKDMRQKLLIGENLSDNHPMSGAFLVEKDERYMLLAGQNELATVYAVYDLLGKLGCKFSPEGEEKTIIPPKTTSLYFSKTFSEIKKPDADFQQRFNWIKEKIATSFQVKKPDISAKNYPFIVQNGKASSVIVISSHATDKEIFAAEQLQKYIKEMTGTDVPISQDNVTDLESNQLIISVGRTVYLQEDLKKELKIGQNLSALNNEHDEFAIVKTPGILYLVGHRDQATIWAVFELLERLGCRWFFGNDAGTIIPKDLFSLEVKECKILRKPDFAVREIYVWWDYLRDESDIASEDFWHIANRFSEGPPRGDSGHNFDQILPKNIYDTHPEYFSMVNGKRVKPESDVNWQMCLSNPDVIKLSIEWAKKRLSLEPANELVTYAPNDGSGLCECPECKKIGNHSDAFIYFTNHIGKELFPEYPDILLNIWAYAGCSVIPQNLKADGYDQNKDRVVVTMFENSCQTPWLELISGYSKCVHRICLNKIWHIIGYDAGGIRPVNYTNTFSEFPFYKKHNVVSVSLQAVPHWASNGFYIYTVGKLMWDAEADIKAIREDFCQKMFPSAVKEFTEFLDLYDLKGKYVRRPYGNYHPENFTEKPDEITWQEWISKGLNCLEKMRTKIRDPQEKKRWQFYALYMHEQVLEWEILEIPGTDEEKVARFMELISFLKGIKDIRVVQSNMAIGKGFGGPMRVVGYPGRDLEFKEIPSMPVNDKIIMDLFEKDKRNYPVSAQ